MSSRSRLGSRAGDIFNPDALKQLVMSEDERKEVFKFRGAPAVQLMDKLLRVRIALQCSLITDITAHFRHSIFSASKANWTECFCGQKLAC